MPSCRISPCFRPARHGRGRRTTTGLQAFSAGRRREAEAANRAQQSGGVFRRMADVFRSEAAAATQPRPPPEALPNEYFGLPPPPSAPLPPPGVYVHGEVRAA